MIRDSWVTQNLWFIYALVCGCMFLADFIWRKWRKKR